MADTDGTLSTTSSVLICVSLVTCALILSIVLVIIARILSSIKRALTGKL